MASDSAEGMVMPAPARKSRRATLPDWRSLVRLALATALLCIAAFVAWQGVLVVRERSAIANAENARDEAVAAIGTLIEDVRTTLTKALADPRVQAAVSRNDEAGRAQAASLLRAAVPAIEDARFYSAQLDEIIVGDLRELGYARAAMLMQAQARGNVAPAQARLEQNRPAGLVFAMPVQVDGKVSAYAMVQWSWQPVQAAFERRDVAPARLDLRQGDGQDDPRIASTGADAKGSDSDAGVPIANSRLHIGVAPPGYFIVLPRAPLWLLLFALACAAGGFGVLWLRLIGAGHRLTRSDSGADDAEPTVAEAIEHERNNGSASAAPVEPKAPAKRREEPPVAIDASIFRAYDIRGVIGATLDASVARAIGRAIGSEARERGFGDIVVGRDGRVSGPDMAAALIDGLRASGVDVIDIGMAPTPVTYFACQHVGSGSGVSVTGSHNPPDHNGFKIVLGGQTLAEDAIQALYRRIVERRFSEGSGGLQTTDFAGEYRDRIAADIQVARRLKVVVDCGNGVGGEIAPAVLAAIGCEVEPLYCEIDGTFPNHHPDPSDLDNLKDLILAVERTGADLGVAFDGDADRLGVVAPNGEVIFPDRLLMLFAQDVLERNPGASIIYDVKCTNRLQPLIIASGGSPIMWKTGHSLIKAKMRETGALLAGEMSGHFFFKERWYGFDDGIYAAARLVELLAGDIADRSVQEILDSVPKGAATPELKVAMPEGTNHAFVAAFARAARFDGAHLTTIDGLRADWPDGFGLVRASNTTSILVLRFGADDDAALERIQEAFRAQLLAFDANLELPFP
jgi:phosphomannomutase/phosphoglucomutase